MLLTWVIKSKRTLLTITERGPYQSENSVLHCIGHFSTNTVVVHSLIVRWVVVSILHGGPIDIFLVPASAPQLVLQRPWYVLSCLWDGAYKRSLAANLKFSFILILRDIQNSITPHTPPPATDPGWTACTPLYTPVQVAPPLLSPHFGFLPRTEESAKAGT